MSRGNTQNILELVQQKARRKCAWINAAKHRQQCGIRIRGTASSIAVTPMRAS